ncbi:hypothetical protein AVEN_261886-1 [Araneus ventricosus]|uniref:Uncharacterized protein n=1 Tax=Araneus ventricosus TaxID=182803 RepID=A0A4Y2KUS5_ARAVE|nr:hypothetical protein AVEN_261886-1 [Araneus ventricosus]
MVGTFIMEESIGDAVPNKIQPTFFHHPLLLGFLNENLTETLSLIHDKELLCEFEMGYTPLHISVTKKLQIIARILITIMAFIMEASISDAARDEENIPQI